jgi:hypothetical protein
MTKRGKGRDVGDNINNNIIVHGSLFSFSRLMVVAKPKTNARILFTYISIQSLRTVIEG